MQTYKKRPAGASAQRNGAVPENPLAGGMPSLVDGASRKDLPEAMRTKMENAFGADFSNLNIIESEKVAEGGAKAVTQGNTIAFAPGEFNLYSPTGEALLGHELSHVVSQARGESRGNGLVDNSYLEAKADREGVMAAAGQTVYNGPVTPISNSTPMSVAGPMQCKKSKKEKRELNFQMYDLTANSMLQKYDPIKRNDQAFSKSLDDDTAKYASKYLMKQLGKARYYASKIGKTLATKGLGNNPPEYLNEVLLKGESYDLLKDKILNMETIPLKKRKALGKVYNREISKYKDLNTHFDNYLADYRKGEGHEELLQKKAIEMGNKQIIDTAKDRLFWADQEEEKKKKKNQDSEQ